MPKTVISPWEPHKLQGSLLFEPVRPVLDQFLGLPEWPTVEQLDKSLFNSDRRFSSADGAPIKLVPQDEKSGVLEEHYAPRIYLQGEIQTREQNWHDFFQAATWALFPKTKVAINALHYPAAKYRFDNSLPKGSRTSLENSLSQFDECGVILYSTRPDLLEMVRQFEWHELFWSSRSDLGREFGCIVYGHAIYEKAINPYVGLTAKAILLEVDTEIFKLSQDERVGKIDSELANYFQDPPRINTPKDLSPFPILGMPCYYPNNDNEEFYFNQQYFRPGRKTA